MQLDGKTNSFKEKRKLDIEQLKSTIKHLKCFIERKAQQKETQFNKLQKVKQTDLSFEKCIKKYRNIKFVFHQKKRRLRNLEQKSNKLKADEKSNNPRICFGSKDLFHKQFRLKENNYKTHQEWKKEWQEARSAQFLVIGSKDETFGNQTATYDLQNRLRLRVATNLFQNTVNTLTSRMLTFLTDKSI